MDRSINPFDSPPETPQPFEVKAMYFDFFRDFKNYFSRYLEDSINELCIAEVVIGQQPLELFDGKVSGKVTVKNQGQIECYISTGKIGGYRLSPGDKETFWVNHKVTITTASGTTTIGFIKS